MPGPQLPLSYPPCSKLKSTCNVSGSTRPKDPFEFLDNAGRTTVGEFLHREVVGARRVCICVGYISIFGLDELAAWLDVMAPDGKMLLLIGMAPRNWRYLADSSGAYAKYILGSMKHGTRASDLDSSVLTRLADHQRTGRLEVCLRHPRSRIHAKLYLVRTRSNAWTGLAGSSNLSKSGLEQPGEFNLVLEPDAALAAGKWFTKNWKERESVLANDVWETLLDMAVHRPEPKRSRTLAAPTPTTRVTRRSGGWGCLRLLVGLAMLVVALLLLA